MHDKTPIDENPADQNLQIQTETPHSPFSIFLNYHNKLKYNLL